MLRKFGGRRSEVGSRRSEVGGRKSEVGSQRSEVGGRRPEVGGRKSEVGGQRSEVGGRKSEVRGRRSEVGGRRSEVGGRRSESGTCRNSGIERSGTRRNASSEIIHYSLFIIHCCSPPYSLFPNPFALRRGLPSRVGGRRSGYGLFWKKMLIF